MRNFKYLGEMDTLVALAELQDHHWHADDFLRSAPQGPFGETDSVILRFPPRTEHESAEALLDYAQKIDVWDCVWLPISQDFLHTKKLVFDLARAVEATRIGRVIINRVQPGGRIFKHADTPIHALTWCRYHIVLHALPGVKFSCGNDGEEEHVGMLTNQVWYFANELPHEVVNNSPDPRLHLVVDLRCEAIKP